VADIPELILDSFTKYSFTRVPRGKIKPISAAVQIDASLISHCTNFFQPNFPHSYIVNHASAHQLPNNSTLVNSHKIGCAFGDNIPTD
jgi:hypothetical protein